MFSTVQIKLISLETSEQLCIVTKILGYDCQNISDLFVALIKLKLFIVLF